ncbi:phosphatase PAP2 family protein [Pseudobacillus sp. 179-B 2D1 NHS]|uniref:phosphatase PAP2 family protein n=1 Tax=Pseudobacillus sp. 179-B 2D1 NHS TaxID=3374292 RepID=UPI0038796D3E
MDRSLFYYINGLARHNMLLDKIMIGLSKWRIYAFIFLILLSIFKKGRKIQVIYALLSLAAALIISRILKYIINRERPFLTEDVHLLFLKSPSPSFPSDQGVICGLFAAFVWAVFPKWRWPAAILAFLVSISRVYVGHHYPSDVTAGWFIGILCFMAIYAIKPKEDV